MRTAYKIPADRITIIPGVIDSELFAQSKKVFNKERPVFVYVGRLLKSKGIEDIMEGLSKLRTDYPKLKLLIYGKEVEKGYRAKLEKTATENKWDFVEFMGLTNDVPEALKNGDIFVLPSQTEGFAMSVLEAAAAGKPVIATKVGAIPEIIDEGKSGLFVEWHQPEQIYLAAKKLLDEGLVEKFGIEANKKALTLFSKENVAKEYFDLYKSILGKN